MTRAITSSNPKPPTPQMVARGELAADDYDNGGWKPIFEAHNTNEHQKRAVIVEDTSPVAILTQASKALRFWVKCLGQTGNTETLKVRLWGKRTDGGAGSPSFEVQASIVGGATLGPQEFNGGSDTGGAWWTMSDSLNIVHDVEYQELHVEIATKTDMATAEIWRVEVYYERARTTAHAGVYDNGIVPQEVTEAAAAKYCTAGRSHDLHNGAIAIHNEHTSQVAATARPEAPLDPSDTGGFGWTGFAPPGVTKARFIIRGRGTDEDSAPYTWTVTSDAGGSKDVSPTIESMADYGPFDLTVAENRRVRFELVATPDTEIEAISMWWGDAVYAG